MTYCNKDFEREATQGKVSLHKSKLMRDCMGIKARVINSEEEDAKLNYIWDAFNNNGRCKTAKDDDDDNNNKSRGRTLRRT